MVALGDHHLRRKVHVLFRTLVSGHELMYFWLFLLELLQHLPPQLHLIHCIGLAKQVGFFLGQLQTLPSGFVAKVIVLGGCDASDPAIPHRHLERVQAEKFRLVCQRRAGCLGGFHRGLAVKISTERAKNRAEGNHGDDEAAEPVRHWRNVQTHAGKERGIDFGRMHRLLFLILAAFGGSGGAGLGAGNRVFAL